MKHLSDYYEAWDFGYEMYEKTNHTTVEEDWIYTELYPWTISKIHLFTYPSVYQIWINDNPPSRKKYPIVYLVAENDVIPILINKNPRIILSNPDELNYAESKYGEILRVAYQIVSENADVLLDYWHGIFHAITITFAMSDITNRGWNIIPDYLNRYHADKPFKINVYNDYRKRSDLLRKIEYCLRKMKTISVIFLFRLKKRFIHYLI